MVRDTEPSRGPVGCGEAPDRRGGPAGHDAVA